MILILVILFGLIGYFGYNLNKAVADINIKFNDHEIAQGLDQQAVDARLKELELRTLTVDAVEVKPAPKKRATRKKAAPKTTK